MKKSLAVVLFVAWSSCAFAQTPTSKDIELLFSEMMTHSQLLLAQMSDSTLQSKGDFLQLYSFPDGDSLTNSMSSHDMERLIHDSFGQLDSILQNNSFNLSQELDNQRFIPDSLNHFNDSMMLMMDKMLQEMMEQVQPNPADKKKRKLYSL